MAEGSNQLLLLLCKLLPEGCIVLLGNVPCDAKWDGLSDLLGIKTRYSPEGSQAANNAATWFSSMPACGSIRNNARRKMCAVTCERVGAEVGMQMC